MEQEGGTIGQRVWNAVTGPTRNAVIGVYPWTDVENPNLLSRIEALECNFQLDEVINNL